MERLLLTACLIVVCASAAAAAKSGLPDMVVPDCLGVNIHFTGPEQKQVDQIADGGFRFVRMDFSWVHIETEKGKYDFRAYDELLDTLDSRGIRALFILDYHNPFYDNNQAPHTDEGRAAFARFAKAGAERYKGRGVLWEIWNEPNSSMFWRPAANVEDYVKLAKAVYPALKQADPDCTVLAPALAGADMGFIRAAFGLGLLECTDAVSLHAYGSAKPEDAVGFFSAVRTLVSKYVPKGRQIPIVSGEWGYSAVRGFTVERQGEFLVRSFLSNMMDGVRLSIWYDWHDDGPDPEETEHHFGTVYLDFQPKPAYSAMQTLSRELAGYSFASRISIGSEQDYLALFRKGDDYRLAAWTTGEPRSVRVAIDVPRVEVVSISGERAQVDVRNGGISVRLTGAVTYIKPLTPSRRWAIEAGWQVSAAAVMERGGVVAEMISQSEGTNPELTISGPGLKTARAKPGGDAQPIKCRTGYVSTGAPRARIKATLRIDELAEPLERMVELDTSACPRIEVLPPTKGELLILVGQPISGARGEFRGKVVIGNADGLRLESESADFVLPRDKDSVTVGLKMTQRPTTIFSFALKVVNEVGEEIVRMPAKRYSIVETFAEGSVGDPVGKYAVELDGDSKVPAEVKLTYVKAQTGGPRDICARLDYEFGDGWRFVRVSPRPTIRIFEKPRIAKLWLQGDGRDGHARLRFVDSDGQTFQPNYARLDFSEWRCIEADLTGESAGHWGGKNDGMVRYPISWDTIFLLDNTGGRKSKGTIFLGPLMLCYD